MLIGLASFAVFSRVSDYAITSRELDRAAAFYRGVAILNPGVPNTRQSVFLSMAHSTAPTLRGEFIDAFAALPYVSSVDRRYMTSGVSDRFMRIDFEMTDIRFSPWTPTGPYNHTNRFIVE